MARGLSGVAVERRDTGEGSDLGAAQGAELGQQDAQRGGGDPADAADVLEDVDLGLEGVPAGAAGAGAAAVVFTSALAIDAEAQRLLLALSGLRSACAAPGR